VRSCEYQVDAIEKFLEEMRVKVHNMERDEYLIQQQAIELKLTEKDLNLMMEFNRNLMEINTH